MADFIRVGGVRMLVNAESFVEDMIPIGQAAEGELSINGRPIEASMGETRRWHFSIPRDVLTNPKGLALAEGAVSWRALYRWLRGYGQCFPCTGQSQGVPISGSGFTFTPQANVSMAGGVATVTSGTTISHKFANSMRTRSTFRGNDGFTAGFQRTYVAGEQFSAGNHWVVGTGSVEWNEGTANPGGLSQYVDGAPVTNKNIGNFWGMHSPASAPISSMVLKGIKDDGVTNSAIAYFDIFMVPFVMPASWISQIWTNLINAGKAFPVLPRQKLDGLWIPDTSPVQAIGRVGSLNQRVGSAIGGSAWRSDLREIDVTFTEY